VPPLKANTAQPARMSCFVFICLSLVSPFNEVAPSAQLEDLLEQADGRRFVPRLR
jgi:hypothetical protein